MSYISKSNLDSNLTNQLDKINELESLLNNIKQQSEETLSLDISHDIIIQNEDYSFSPQSLLINAYKGNVFAKSEPYPVEYRIHYSTRTNRGLWLDYDNYNLLPPSSILINLDNSPIQYHYDIQYIRITCYVDNELLKIKFIPVVRNGDKGEPLKFEDLTLEQRELIRGEQGIKGETGEIGLVYYDSNGVIPHRIKIFTGETTVTEGIWTINYSHIGFTKILGVIPTPIQPTNTTAAETATGATVTTYSNTTATGKVLKGTSAGLLAAMSNLYLNDTNAKVQVLVIGY